MFQPVLFHIRFFKIVLFSCLQPLNQSRWHTHTHPHPHSLVASLPSCTALFLSATCSLLYMFVSLSFRRPFRDFHHPAACLCHSLSAHRQWGFPLLLFYSFQSCWSFDIPSKVIQFLPVLFLLSPLHSSVSFFTFSTPPSSSLPLFPFLPLVWTLTGV